MEISCRRPSVIQAMRDQPPCKLQRMTVYPETFVGNEGCSQAKERQTTPRKAEGTLLSDSICDDQETQIILKYIHKKFSKYQRAALL